MVYSDLCFFCLNTCPNELTKISSDNNSGFQLFCKLLNIDNEQDSADDEEIFSFCTSCSSRLNHLQTIIGIFNQVKRDIQDSVGAIKTNFIKNPDNCGDDDDFEHSVSLYKSLRKTTESRLSDDNFVLIWDNLTKENLNQFYQEINYIQFHEQESLNTSCSTDNCDFEPVEEIEVKPTIQSSWNSESISTNSSSTSTSLQNRKTYKKKKQNPFVKLERLDRESNSEKPQLQEQDEISSELGSSKNLRLKQRLKRKIPSTLPEIPRDPILIIPNRLRPRSNKNKRFLSDSSDDEADTDWTVPEEDSTDPKQDISESDEFDEEDHEPEQLESLHPPRKRGRKKSSLSSDKYRRKDGKFYYEGIQFLESVTEWTCTICEEKFPRIKNHRKLFKHIDKHKGILRYKCIECSKEYSSTGGLLKHRKTSHTVNEEDLNKVVKLFKCSVCGKPSKDSEKAIAHEKWNHMSREEYEAELALGKKPPKKVAHLMHWMKGLHKAPEGSKSYICATCGLGYAKAYNLKQHEETVHGTAEIFICCGREFKGKRKFQIHNYRAHRTSINNKCQYCGKCTQNKSTLIRHLKQVHNEFGGKNFVCNLCPFRAASSSRLRMHLDCHGTEKRFKCDFCDLAFKLKWTLTRHRMVIHKDQLSKLD